MGSRPATSPASAIPTFVDDDPFVIQEVQEHLEPFLGKPDWVLHDLIGHLIHLDVHIVPPSEARPWIGVFTTGMSARPMRVPAEHRKHFPEYVELMLRLPPDWFGGRKPSMSRLRGAAGWPIRLLVEVARMPFVSNTFVGAGHTYRYADGSPFEPGVPFTTIVFDPPCFGEEALPPMSRLYGGEAQVLGLVLLHEEESRFLVANRYRALFERLDPAGVTDLLDPGRPSVIGAR